ncbi:hypothetical protein [Microbacterium thalli]|uniref:Uncharacterized protein n=1 Tax=Microbacterium thalli TaxID=3027921 RepID=A0ABT5SIR3_9MICO|nr:hypothetical protein [Microbacterium thalli]MDD7929366.1 hypothetical protein [Microbacterium thalli]MDD7961952.1 hypothetical protein [Microbacterium thalli]
MDRIHYAGDSVVTGSDVARALLGYAQALAQVGSSATVDIPVVGTDGTQARWEVLVGPASQITSRETDWDGPELRDDVLVARLRRQADQLRNRGTSAAVATEDPDFGGAPQAWSDFDTL